MKKSKNIHGLSRYVPVSVARQVRKEAGYGCAICGALFTDYEHIEPEFHDAKEHDPSKMTLLCGTHHDDVTFKRISKKDVWKAKGNPKNKYGDAILRGMYHQKDTAEVSISSNNFKLLSKIIVINGKPLIWFESSGDDDEPVRLCAIFNGVDGKPHAFINRNIFRSEVGEYDIVTKGAGIEVRDVKEGVLLNVTFEGGERVIINALKMRLMDINIIITKADGLVIKTNNGTFSLANSSLSGFNGGDVGGLYYGGILKSRMDGVGFMSRVRVFTSCAFSSVEILSYGGCRIGWVSGNVIVNEDYDFVALVNDVNAGVYNFHMELIGYLKEFHENGKIKYYMIISECDELESGEPIYVIPADRGSLNVRNATGFDVGYRVSKNNIFY